LHAFGIRQKPELEQAPRGPASDAANPQGLEDRRWLRRHKGGQCRARKSGLTAQILGSNGMSGHLDSREVNGKVPVGNRCTLTGAVRERECRPREGGGSPRLALLGAGCEARDDAAYLLFVKAAATARGEPLNGASHHEPQAAWMKTALAPSW